MIALLYQKRSVIVRAFSTVLVSIFLKQKAPLWLAQHPDVMAFHQAPLEFGGDGALLVLLSIPEKEKQSFSDSRFGMRERTAWVAALTDNG